MSASTPATTPPKPLSPEEFATYFQHLRRDRPDLTAREFFDIVHNVHLTAERQFRENQSAAASAAASVSSTGSASATPTPTPKSGSNPSRLFATESPASTPTDSTSGGIIDITRLNEDIAKERNRLREVVHQHNVAKYEEFKRQAELEARRRDDAEDAQFAAAVRGQFMRQPVDRPADARAAAAVPPPHRRGIPEMIGDGLRFIGQLDVMDAFLRYGLFALLISNGNWRFFFIIVLCLVAYMAITHLLGMIEFRRGQAPQANINEADNAAAAAAAPVRQRRPQDCSTAFRVWYVCFKLFLLFFVSFLPWFKVEGLRRELHYEGVLRYPEDLIVDPPAAPAQPDARNGEAVNNHEDENGGAIEAAE